MFNPQKMDYFSAFGMVLTSFLTITFRFINDNIGLKNSKLNIAIGMPFLAFFIYHIHYLYFVKFDYGYNMKANVAVGK